MRTTTSRHELNCSAYVAFALHGPPLVITPLIAASSKATWPVTSSQRMSWQHGASIQPTMSTAS